MKKDPTEQIRREMIQQINTDPRTAIRALLEKKHGADNVWNTDQMQDQFNVISFAAPFIIVTRKTTGQRGTLMFRHNPRLYYSWSSE